MNRTTDSELDILVNRTLKGDLAPEVEARMNRHFLDLRRSLDMHAPKAPKGALTLSLSVIFQKRILVFASIIMLLLGGVMHLSGTKSAVAGSILRLKVVDPISEVLINAASMDCALQVADGGTGRLFRVRWVQGSMTRVDIASANNAEHTFWISNEAIAADSALQPALEFLTPATLARNLEERYRVAQVWTREASSEFLLVGEENQQVVEIAVDQKTYLPKTLKKYAANSSRTLMEVRFIWNQPIAADLH
jgi:hypothetical protein